MILGVFYHAALIYSTAHRWRVADPQTAKFFADLAISIHTFRMPTFFIIAGFFALFSLERYGSRRFLFSRAQRLVLPFIATLLTANVLQTFVSYCLVANRPVRPAQVLHLFPGYLLTTYCASHLWFLLYLGVFSLLLIACVWLRPLSGLIPMRARLSRTADQLTTHGTIIFLLPACQMAEHAIAKALGPAYTAPVFGYFLAELFFENLPFFFFGAWMYRRKDLLASFTRINYWCLAAFVVGLALEEIAPRPGVFKLSGTVHAYGHGLVIWSACQFCFVLFKWLCDRPSRLFSYLAEASYTIYLFHHLCVIYFGYLLTLVTMNVYLKFAVLLSITFLLTLGMHEFVIMRFGLMRLLFNGKTRKKRKPAIPPRPDGSGQGPHKAPGKEKVLELATAQPS